MPDTPSLRIPCQLLVAALLFFAGQKTIGQAPGSLPTPASPVSIKPVIYNGWRSSLLLRNKKAEVLIAPLLGRVMQFRLRGEEGVLWENLALIGRLPNPKAMDWNNFGGDKVWPSPQSDWLKITSRQWPPPAAFDSMPQEATVSGPIVELFSPVDSAYGIRTRRIIRLDPYEAVLDITTRFEKVEGKPIKTALWVITQLKEPVGIFIPLVANTTLQHGYTQLSQGPPLDLKSEAGLISLRRNPQANAKIGSDSGSVAWVGEKQALRIECPRIDGQEYPDKGSSIAVYTNADPQKYVDIEMLSPLKLLKVGDRLETTTTYTLRRRTVKDPAAEASKILELQRQTE